MLEEFLQFHRAKPIAARFRHKRRGDTPWLPAAAIAQFTGIVRTLQQQGRPCGRFAQAEFLARLGIVARADLDFHPGRPYPELKLDKRIQLSPALLSER